MTLTLEDYAAVVGKDSIDELRILAAVVGRKQLQNINSTAVGGGVAEILTRMLPLLRQLGVDVRWDVIHGDDAFFEVTKAIHNGLHGQRVEFTGQMKEIYRAAQELNLSWMEITGDVVMIHDPQPAGLIAQKRNGGNKWIWRCHIDVSSPQTDVWEFLRPLVEAYDAAVFSMPEFARPLPMPQYLIAPSIDPLSEKNIDLGAEEIRKTLEGFGIDPERPVLTQISRFDRLKDPLGVVAAYRMVKRRHPCQLVLAGGGASDDPEGEQVLAEVREAAAGDPDIHILVLPPFSDRAINALVRGSTIVLQKSVREGFGLTVTEALWKSKPVIGGAVGGIKQQIIDGVTGLLVHSVEGAALAAERLLADADLRQGLGVNGHLHVRQNFLITRHVKDYLLLMTALDHPGEHVVYLN